VTEQVATPSLSWIALHFFAVGPAVQTDRARLRT
jgi:hypothetical protein